MSKQYPIEVIRVMAKQIYDTRSTVAYWFKRRHTTHNAAGVRMWIAELRRIDRASGYSECVRQAGTDHVRYNVRAL